MRISLLFLISPQGSSENSYPKEILMKKTVLALVLSVASLSASADGSTHKCYTLNPDDQAPYQVFLMSLSPDQKSVALNWTHPKKSIQYYFSGIAPEYGGIQYSIQPGGVYVALEIE